MPWPWSPRRGLVVRSMSADSQSDGMPLRSSISRSTTLSRSLRTEAETPPAEGGVDGVCEATNWVLFGAPARAALLFALRTGAGAGLAPLKNPSKRPIAPAPFYLTRLDAQT